MVRSRLSGITRVQMGWRDRAAVRTTIEPLRRPARRFPESALCADKSRVTIVFHKVQMLISAGATTRGLLIHDNGDRISLQRAPRDRNIAVKSPAIWGSRMISL